MKTPGLILLFVLTGLGAARAETPADWGTNLTAALREAAPERKPVLVWFTASWCGPCQVMAHTTLADPLVQQALAGLGHVAVDIDEHQALADQYQIRAVPTFDLLSPDGDAVVSATGFQTADEFLQWITNGLDEVKSSGERQARAREQLAETDRLLLEPDAESTRKAAAELFDLCGGREAASTQAATARLKTLAARSPSVLLDGLNHPRLAARIQAANILRAQLGDSFDIDPWSEAATRTAAISAWRAKLENSNSRDAEKP